MWQEKKILLSKRFRHFQTKSNKIVNTLKTGQFVCTLQNVFGLHKKRYGLYKKKWAAMKAAHSFDNPKTNLTYEKNLYIF